MILYTHTLPVTLSTSFKHLKRRAPSNLSVYREAIKSQNMTVMTKFDGFDGLYIFPLITQRTVTLRCPTAHGSKTGCEINGYKTISKGSVYVYTCVCVLSSLRLRIYLVQLTECFCYSVAVIGSRCRLLCCFQRKCREIVKGDDKLTSGGVCAELINWITRDIN